MRASRAYHTRVQDSGLVVPIDPFKRTLKGALATLSPDPPYGNLSSGIKTSMASGPSARI